MPHVEFKDQEPQLLGENQEQQQGEETRDEEACQGPARWGRTRSIGPKQTLESLIYPFLLPDPSIVCSWYICCTYSSTISHVPGMETLETQWCQNLGSVHWCWTEIQRVMEEKFLCQTKREHSRLAPQELCPPPLLGEGLIDRVCGQGRWCGSM